jgi:TnpA family transposase
VPLTSQTGTIGGQLNLHGQLHSLPRAVFHGKKGEVRKLYLEHVVHEPSARSPPP